MRKKFLAALLICTLCVLTGCGSSSNKKLSSDLSNPTSFERAGYSIDIPDDWARTNNKNADLAFFYTASRNNTFTENITTMIQDLSAYDYTLDAYKDLSVSSYEDMGYTIDNCKKQKVNNVDCYSITSHTTNDDTKVYCKQLFTVRSQKAYLFTFAATKDNFNSLSAEVDAIFDTITFNDNTEVSTDETTSAAPAENTSESTSEVVTETPADTAAAAE